MSVLGDPMRTITIRNFSKNPPQLLATVIMHDDGRVAINGEMRAELENGVYWYRTRELIGPETGDQFMNAILMEYKGAYVRASEIR